MLPTKKLITLSALILALAFYTISAKAENQGTAEAVQGYVTVTDSNGETRRLKEGETINIGDVVNTGNSSAVVLVLANGQVVNLGQLASYTHNSQGLGGSNGSGGSFANSPLSTTGSSSGSSPGSTTGGGLPVLSTTQGAGGSPTN